jgi:hypothetical protein
MRLSTSDYACPNKSTDWVVSSYNGYTLYLLVVGVVRLGLPYEV